jgi:hypothetical protein
MTSAEAEVGVMACCFGRLANFLDKVGRFPEIVESRGPRMRWASPPLAIDSLPVRPEARLQHLPD